MKKLLKKLAKKMFLAWLKELPSRFKAWLKTLPSLLLSRFKKK